MGEPNENSDGNEQDVGVGSDVEFEVIPPGEQDNGDTTDSSNNQ